MNKLVYTEENDLRIYESMPDADFKEFFMAYFKYKKGDKVNISDFTNPMTFAMFCQYIPKLDKMEDNYNKKTAANRENGKKGGRPRKDETSDLKPSEPVNEQTPQPVENKPVESLKIANNDNREIPVEFAIEEPVKTDVRLDNILTIPVNKPSLFSDYLTKFIHLHKKDTIGSMTAYEEIEKEEVLDGMRNILLSSGYAADSVDDTIEECVTSTIAA